jgi:hypothetical protein
MTATPTHSNTKTRNPKINQASFFNSIQRACRCVCFASIEITINPQPVCCPESGFENFEIRDLRFQIFEIWPDVGWRSIPDASQRTHRCVLLFSLPFSTFWATLLMCVLVRVTKALDYYLCWAGHGWSCISLKSNISPWEIDNFSVIILIIWVF